MVVVSGEISRQSRDAGGDFQKAISETVSLCFGNGHTIAAARNPFGNPALVRRFGRRGKRFHGWKLTHRRVRSNRFDRAREFAHDDDEAVVERGEFDAWRQRRRCRWRMNVSCQIESEWRIIGNAIGAIRIRVWVSRLIVENPINEPACIPKRILFCGIQPFDK